METKNLQIIKSQFRFNEQGYTLMKSAFYIYVLRKSGINYNIGNKNNIMAHRNNLTYLHKLVKDNLDKIEECCGRVVGDLIKDCILGFSDYYVTGTGINNALYAIDEMSEEGIEELFVEHATSYGNKEDSSIPNDLSELVFKLLDPNGLGKWFDFNCGNGDFLVTISKLSKNIEVLGEDLNYNQTLLTKLRLYFLGVKNSIRQNDALDSEYFEMSNFAFVNTPFLLRLGNKTDSYNLHNRHLGKLKSSQNADWIFADRLIQVSKERSAMLMTEASLMNFIDIEQRKDVVNSNLLEGVIKLPVNLLPYTAISCSLVIFNKNKNNKNIKFLDASSMCVKGRRFSELNVSEIVDSYNNASTIVNNESIIENDYCLNVKRYLDVSDIVLDNSKVLKEVVYEVFRGVQIPAQTIDEYSKDVDDNTYKLLSVGDIQNGFFEIKNLQTITNDGRFERYLLKNGDVLVSSKSTKIKTCVIEGIDNYKIVATGSLLVIRCDENKINPVYLKAFFDSINGSKLLESIQTGTAIISINASALLNMKISCIDREKQDKIAAAYLERLDQFKITQNKLRKLENELNTVFDKFVEG